MLVTDVGVLANFPLEQSHDCRITGDMAPFHCDVNDSIPLVGYPSDFGLISYHIVAFLGYHYTDLKGDVKGYFNLFFMLRRRNSEPVDGEEMLHVTYLSIDRAFEEQDLERSST